MRLVRSSPNGGGGVFAGSEALAARELLEGARRLGESVPGARLRECPVVRAAELDARADPTGSTRVWLALEALQLTGSFKVRGALLALSEGMRRWVGRPVVVAASAGNHGAGVAYAASVLGVRARIVVPRGAPRAKCERMAEWGAEIVYAEGTHYDDAEALAKQLAEDGGHPFVSPYDDVAVVAGNGGSLGYEIARALGGVPERVLAPFGGGGLATGLAWAFADAAGNAGDGARDNADRVWGVQSESSPVMASSLERGAAIEHFLPTMETLAEGLEGGISSSAFARARAAVAGVVVVTEDQIAQAMGHIYRDMGIVVEGSAATALVPVLEGLPEALCGGDLVVVLSGRNVDRERWEAAVRA